MSKRLLLYAAVYLLYLLVAVVITYPLITVLDSRVIGHPFGDSTEYLRHIWWFKHALQTGLSPFDQPLLLYPDGISGALLWSIPLQSFPAWLLAFVMPLPAAFNVAALLRLALNGWAMWLLVQYLTTGQGARGIFPALLAGLVFMLYPAFQGQLAVGHTGLLAVWPTPLLALALLRLREDARWIGLAAGLFVMSSWGGLVLLIYLVAPVVVLVLWLARADGRALRRMGVALLLGGLISALFILPSLGDAAPNSGAVTFSASLLAVVSPSFNHPLYAGLEYPRRVIGVDPFEGASYIGLVGGGLALMGARRARSWLALALIAWVFSLGPLLKVYDSPLVVNVGGYITPIPLPWALFQSLPGLDIARTPARFNFTVGLAVAVMAGYGAAWLFNLDRGSVHRQRLKPPAAEKPSPLKGLKIRVFSPSRRKSVGCFPLGATRQIAPTTRVEMLSRFSGLGNLVSRYGWRGVLVFILALLIILDYQFFWPLPTIPAAIPDVVAALGAREGVRAVFNLPWAHPLVDKDGLYLQTAHGLPMIGGHVARETPLDPAKGWLLQTTLDPALLHAAGADIIILHKEWDEPELEAFTREQLGTPFYEDERIALFETPTADAPGFIAAPPRIQSDRADLYFYAPAPGEVILTGRVSGDAGRVISISLDDEAIHWTIQSEIALRVPLRVERAGYHTVSIAADPACPRLLDAALRCRGFSFEGLAVEAFER
jgi:hypothetical protein